MLMRIVVGFHFFNEGTTKIKSGFSSKGFLSAAKGPFAPLFKGMLDDPDGMEKLCIEKAKSEDGSELLSTNPDLTFALWNEFLDEATDYYGLGSVELENEISTRREKLADKIQAARADKDASVDTSELEDLREKYRLDILKIRSQPELAEEIFESHKEQLADWLDINELELMAHFSTTDRLDGFARDGENRKQAATYVESLREQIGTIARERSEKLAGWTAEVTQIWDSLEGQINGLAIDDQVDGRGTYTMFRHFDQENSFVKVVDQVIPWFDTIVGILLIIGLFTRFASLAAALFLVSVILTQPPWIPGTAPTISYFIELMALLVVFATCAGRYGGLDFFFSPAVESPQIEGQA